MIQNAIKRMLIKEMERVLDKLKQDKCEMNDDEAMHLISMLCHEAMSKDQVLKYLGWSRSKFDDYVGRGLMPKGKPRSGFKELVWYKDEINDSIIALNNSKYNI